MLYLNEKQLILDIAIHLIIRTTYKLKNFIKFKNLSFFCGGGNSVDLNKKQLNIINFEDLLQVTINKTATSKINW